MLIQRIEFIIRMFENRMIELIFSVSSGDQAFNPETEGSLFRRLVVFGRKEFNAVYKLTPICEKRLAFEVQRWGRVALGVAFEEDGGEQPGAVVRCRLAFQKNDMQMRNSVPQ